MAILVFGLIVFLGIHSVQIVRPGLRERIIQKAGSVSAWKLTFSGLATIGLLLVILGYSLARYQTPVWYQPPAGLRHLALLVMLPVFPLLFATYLKGRISQLVGHPMLAATALWAIAHLLANGSMADVLRHLRQPILDGQRKVLGEHRLQQSQSVADGAHGDLALFTGALVLFGDR